MNIVKLKTNVNMIEVMRRFHNSEATVIKATYYRGQRPKKIEGEGYDEDGRRNVVKVFDNPYWSILYNGKLPNLTGLVQ